MTVLSQKSPAWWQKFRWSRNYSARPKTHLSSLRLRKSDRGKVYVTQKDVLEAIDAEGLEFYKQGCKDGDRKVFPVNIDIVTKTKAEHWYHFIHWESKENKEAAQDAVTHIQEQYAHRKQRLDESIIYEQEQAKIHSDSFEKSHFWVGLFYIAIAAVLFVGDYAITKKTVQEVLQISTNNPEESIPLALGILFAGFIFKFIYEWYLLPPIQQLEENLNPNNKSKRGQRLFLQIIRLTAHLVLMFLVGYILYQLGEIRGEIAKKRINGEKIGDGLSNINSTFTWLGLLLPVVGAICFSEGLSRLTKWGKFFSARRRRYLNQKFAKKVQLRLQQTKRQYKHFESLEEWLTDEEGGLQKSWHLLFRSQYYRGHSENYKEYGHE